VEDFWALWNIVKGPHELRSGCNFYYFKKGIEPKWEDAANSKGGRWLIFVKSNVGDEELSNLWLHVVCPVAADLLLLLT
jgi:translation initiation factor 4E